MTNLDMTTNKTQFFNLFFGNYNLSDEKSKFSSTLALLDLLSDVGGEYEMDDLLEYFSENGKNQDLMGKLKQIRTWSVRQRKFSESKKLEFEKLGLILKDDILVMPNEEFIIEPLKGIYSENMGNTNF
ncbi:MAG: hypothetical protein SLAVMIC_00684 [uncultured marine phage]|uniref:Uncharacterized protein n=1 Tax=uncultured marine phage TaxID=707152 RepID=A0A8D9CBZ1_9VIRU|nr:MAG: hypothetical protein SLAVMIC_00684 [uncultured marine phage]